MAKNPNTLSSARRKREQKRAGTFEPHRPERGSGKRQREMGRRAQAGENFEKFVPAAPTAQPAAAPTAAPTVAEPTAPAPTARTDGGGKIFTPGDVKLLQVGAAAALGIIGLGGIVAGIAAIGAKTTAVAAAAKVGTVGLSGTALKAISTAGAFATNTATAAATTSWLAKLAGALKNPALVAGGLVAAIGSYPFAGFIKEESIQTLSFAVRTAQMNGDVEGAKAALAHQAEVLDTTLWEGILDNTPFVNVVARLKEFYEAARTKMAIDTKMVADMEIQQATGESDSEKWDRVRQEQADQEQANIDYYNEERKKMLAFEEEAADRDMQEDAAFWRKERAKQAALEKADREAEAAFWMEYRRESQKLNESLRPSNLKFGLL